MNSKIERLIKQFAKLPRVGGRAAQRITLGLLQDKTGKAVALAAALADAAESVRPCPVCGVLTDSESAGGATFSESRLIKGDLGTRSPHLCEFCSDNGRANGQLCIVRDLGDVWTLEKSGVFRGRYHILGGLLSGMSGMTPEDLNIAGLTARFKAEKITEIIFALPNTVEGKTTQHYVQSVVGAHIMRPDNGRMISAPTFTELASGVPLGGDLDYIDDGTLSLAFGERKKI